MDCLIVPHRAPKEAPRAYHRVHIEVIEVCGANGVPSWLESSFQGCLRASTSSSVPCKQIPDGFRSTILLGRQGPVAVSLGMGKIKNTSLSLLRFGLLAAVCGATLMDTWSPKTKLTISSSAPP